VPAEPPRNTGTDGDGVVENEADHLMTCPVAANGSICAISPRSSSRHFPWACFYVIIANGKIKL
jgi:hypothetical protein